jgi:hypothetical protein
MEGGILGEGRRTLNVTWVAWVFWNGKIVLVQGTNGEGEEERNYWDVCVAVGDLYEMEALFDLEGNCWTCSGSN